MSSSKINVAKQAMNYIKGKLHPDMILGIGTGSTVNFFIEELGEYKNLFSGAVSSSEASSILLNEKGIEVFNLNDVMDIEFYIDGADEVSPIKN
jgi:ribose 5-phosphate isomerase A